MININTYIIEKLHLDKVQSVMIVFGYPGKGQVDYGFFNNIEAAANYISKKNTNWQGAFLIDKKDINEFCEKIYDTPTNFMNFCLNKNIENISLDIIELLKTKK